MTPPAWLPERRRQTWDMGLTTGVILGFGANALLTAWALATGDRLASDPCLYLLFAVIVIPMAGILVILFHRSNWCDQA